MGSASYLTGHDDNHCEPSDEKETAATSVSLLPLVNQRCLNTATGKYSEVLHLSTHTKSQRGQNLLLVAMPNVPFPLAMKFLLCDAINTASAEASTISYPTHIARCTKDWSSRTNSRARKKKCPGLIMLWVRAPWWRVRLRRGGAGPDPA